MGALDYWWLTRDFSTPQYLISPRGEIVPIPLETINDLASENHGFVSIYDSFPGVLTGPERAKIFAGYAPEYAAFIRANFLAFEAKWIAGAWKSASLLPSITVKQWYTNNTHDTHNVYLGVPSSGHSVLTSGFSFNIPMIGTYTDQGWKQVVVGTDKTSSQLPFVNAIMDEVGIPSGTVQPDPNAAAFAPRPLAKYWLDGRRRLYLPTEISGLFTGLIYGNNNTGSGVYTDRSTDTYSGWLLGYLTQHQDPITYTDTLSPGVNAGFTLDTLVDSMGHDIAHPYSQYVGFQIWIPMGAVASVGPVRMDGKISYILIKNDRGFRINASPAEYKPAGKTYPLSLSATPSPAVVAADSKDNILSFDRLTQLSDMSYVLMVGVQNDPSVKIGVIASLYRAFEDYGSGDADTYNVAPVGAPYPAMPKVYWSSTNTLPVLISQNAPAQTIQNTFSPADPVLGGPYVYTPFVINVDGNPYYIGPTGVTLDANTPNDVNYQFSGLSTYELFPQYWTRRPLGFDKTFPAKDAVIIEPLEVSSIFKTLVDEGFCAPPTGLPPGLSEEKSSWLSGMSPMDLYMGYGSVGGFVMPAGLTEPPSRYLGSDPALPIMAVGVSGRVYVHDRLRVLTEGEMTPGNLVYSFLIRDYSTLASVVPRWGVSAGPFLGGIYRMGNGGAWAISSNGCSPPSGVVGEFVVNTAITDDLGVHFVASGGTWYSAWVHLGVGVVWKAAAPLVATTTFQPPLVEGLISLQKTGQPLSCYTVYDTYYDPGSYTPQSNVIFGFDGSSTGNTFAIGPSGGQNTVVWSPVAPFYVTYDRDQQPAIAGMSGGAKLDGGYLAGPTVIYPDGSVKALPELFLHLEARMAPGFMVDIVMNSTTRDSTYDGTDPDAGTGSLHSFIQTYTYSFDNYGSGVGVGSFNDSTATISRARGQGYYTIDSYCGAAYPDGNLDFDAYYVYVSCGTALNYTSGSSPNEYHVVSAGQITVGSIAMTSVNAGSGPTSTNSQGGVFTGTSINVSYTSSSTDTQDEPSGPPIVGTDRQTPVLTAFITLLSLQDSTVDSYSTDEGSLGVVFSYQTQFSAQKKVANLIGSSIEPIGDFPRHQSQHLQQILGGFRLDGAYMGLSLHGNPNAQSPTDSWSPSTPYDWDPATWLTKSDNPISGPNVIPAGSNPDTGFALGHYSPVRRVGRYSFCTLANPTLPIVHAGGNITSHKLFGSAGTIAAGPHGTLVFTAVKPGFCLLVAIDDYNKLVATEIIYVHPGFLWGSATGGSPAIQFRGIMEIFTGPATWVRSPASTRVLGFEGIPGDTTAPGTLELHSLNGDIFVPYPTYPYPGGPSHADITDTFVVSKIHLTQTTSALFVTLDTPVSVAGRTAFQVRAYYNTGASEVPSSPSDVIEIKELVLSSHTSSGLTLRFVDNAELPKGIPIWIYIDLVMDGGNEIARCPFQVTIPS